VNESSPEWITLRSAELSAAIDPQGAQLSLLRDRAGRDLLWNGNAQYWNGRAPLLFPIVGALNGGEYRIGEQHYALGRHGFARGRRFEVASSSDSAATFRLASDAASLAVYPFPFELTVEYALAGSGLAITARLRNTGSGVLPASFGYHPAFRWPLPYGRPRAAHYIEFAEEEQSLARRIDAAGLLRPKRVAVPMTGRRLVLDDALFVDDVLIFDDIQSRAVTLGAGTGPQLDVHFPGAPYLGLWTKPGAPFICIEPWYGITDPVGFTGDFRDKPGVFTLAPGELKAMPMTITLTGLAG
jgi:galactose mutarotase-like enzyme